MLLLSYYATSSTYFQLLLSHFLTLLPFINFSLSPTFPSNFYLLIFPLLSILPLLFLYPFIFLLFWLFFTINKLLSLIQSIFPTLEYDNSLSLSLIVFFFGFISVGLFLMSPCVLCMYVRVCIFFWCIFNSYISTLSWSNSVVFLSWSNSVVFLSCYLFFFDC